MNIGCSATLINKEWLTTQFPIKKILKIASLLKVWEIEIFTHKIDKYLLEPFFFLVTNENNQQVVALIKCKLHLVDNLKANILIGNNIIGPESIIIDIVKEKVYILGCKASLLINAC